MALDAKRIECEQKGKSISFDKHIIQGEPAHWNKEYIMEFISSGKGDLIINGKRHSFTRGGMYFLRFRDNIECNMIGSGTVYRVAIPAECMSKDYLRELTATKANLITYFDQHMSSYIESLFVLLLSCRGQDEDSKYVRHCLINSLYLIFISNFRTLPADTVKTNHERVMDAQCFIHDHFREKLKVKTVADAIDMNEGYLNLIFREEVGIPIYQYIKRVRLEEAYRLATSTNMRCHDIVQAVGFTDDANFLRHFRTEYGASPLQIRKQFKEKL